jgi:hypothetical protein
MSGRLKCVGESYNKNLFWGRRRRTMNLIVERVDVWAATTDDQPGGLAALLRPLKDVGADLDFIIARRSANTPGRAVVFVAPLRGDAEVAAAAEAGFNVANSVHSVRVQGHNAPGLVAEIAETLGSANVNMRGLSAAELGTRFVMYIAFDGEADADLAVTTLESRSGASMEDWHRDAA